MFHLSIFRCNALIKNPSISSFTDFEWLVRSGSILLCFVFIVAFLIIFQIRYRTAPVHQFPKGPLSEDTMSLLLPYFQEWLPPSFFTVAIDSTIATRVKYCPFCRHTKFFADVGPDSNQTRVDWNSSAPWLQFRPALGPIWLHTPD